ncbi:hypothetical protein LTR16_010064, partial [Cryomyces antarcticus]
PEGQQIELQDDQLPPLNGFKLMRRSNRNLLLAIGCQRSLYAGRVRTLDAVIIARRAGLKGQIFLKITIQLLAMPSVFGVKRSRKKQLR